MSQNKPRVLSGIQPSGSLHLGNYFGAIRNWVELQENHDALYCIVDLHALTSQSNPEQLRNDTEQLALDLLACGIDPERSTLFLQSQVPEHSELFWILCTVTSYGDLTRMTQFKDKSEQGLPVTAGLFNYPVLQAADILIYHADKVPVGEDQLQHLELARRIARSFNSSYDDYFPEVEPILSDAPRIMSLADPGSKMSKSLGDKHVVGVFEEESSIRKKIRSAVTDMGLSEVEGQEEMSPGVANLFRLLRLSGGGEEAEKFENLYTEGNLMYSELKSVLADRLLETLAPIRERRRRYAEDHGMVPKILATGARKAREIAKRTLEDVRELVGLWA